MTDPIPTTDPNPQSPIRSPKSNAWWLSTRRRRSEWQSLTATGVATFTGRPRAHYEAAQPGDPVLLYVSKPDHAIRAVGIVTRGLGTKDEGRNAEEGDLQRPTPNTQHPSPDTYIEVQLAFEVPNPPLWRDILGVPGLAEADPIRQRSSGTLFHLSEEEYSALQALIVERNPELAASFGAVAAGEVGRGGDAEETESVAGYDGHNALREEFADYVPIPIFGSNANTLPPVRSMAELQSLTGLPCELLEETRDLLEDTGQIVLHGPPGTGKTWLARGLATLVAGDPLRVRVAQFHPATTYEDFIEGLKPRVDAEGNVTYAVLPGLFVRLCEDARYDPNHHYVLVIDEINRAPLSRVFGELLYALEYRGPQGAVELSASASMDSGRQPFYVPENLLLVGTMNSADRSLALVDYALRRRFRFVEMEPGTEILDRWLRARGNPEAARRAVLDLFIEANRRLSEALDPDHRLGHSYFMLDPLNSVTLDRLWRTAIKPLIAEYFVPPGGEVQEYGALFAKAVAKLESDE